MQGPRSVAVSLSTIRAASGRIAPFLVRTPCLSNPLVDEAVGCRVLLKAEHLQVTGAFKARGAFNVVFGLSEDVAARGVVAHSTGNHGAALACAAQRRGVPCAIVVPATTPEQKKANIARYGAALVECDPTPAARQDAAEAAARRMGGATIVPPFDDVDVVAGQGTIGLELLEDHPDLDVILVPVSGGGMLAGIAAAAADLSPRTKIVAVEPEGKRLGDALFGHQPERCIFTDVELRAQPTVRTIADAMPTKLVGADVVWPILQRHVHQVATVDDDDIRAALKFTVDEFKQVVEPAGAVALAALLSKKFTPPQGTKAKVAVVACGGNVSMDTLAACYAAASAEAS